MRAVTLLNLLAYAAALVLAAGAALVVAAPVVPAASSMAAAADRGVEWAVLPDGRRGVRDACGAVARSGGWKRIASLDLVADELLANLADPGLVVAVSAYAQGPDAWRLAGLPRLAGLSDLEAVLACRPELVLASATFGGTDRLQRLRDAGVTVFDLGPAGGVAAYTANLRRVAAVLGVEERGERLARTLTSRLAAVAAALPPGTRRRRALALTPAGDQVYGGTTGSSFHDILVSAGCEDAAAGRYAEPWPRIGAEEVLAIDPDLLVMRLGATADLRRIPGFARLRALSQPGGVVELPVELFDCPGLSVLDAAERLRELAYPQGGR
jgi:iron complex transport system substrate-binding protein